LTGPPGYSPGPGALPTRRRSPRRPWGLWAANAAHAQDGYADTPLTGVDPGVLARKAGLDWTTEYTNRDLAVHNGICTSLVKGGAVVMEDTVTFYRPDNIPEKSRCFRRMRDISIIQNMQANYKALFGSAAWTNFTVVENTANVQNSADRAKCRDINMVKSGLLSLITAFMNRAWLYSPRPSKKFLQTDQAVQVRDGGSGFNTRMPYVLSGEGNILRNAVEIDTSFAVMATL
jgi:hypothetical protein